MSDDNKPGNEETKPELTPLIDVVFLMISFFVIVSDFSSTQHEQVELPFALNANTKNKPNKLAPIVVNVLVDGTIKIQRQVFGKEGMDEKVLMDHFALEADVAPKEPNPSDPSKPLSALRVIVRADKNAKFEHVQKVMVACAKNGIYKMVIQAVKEPLDPVR
ncbi:MAG: ExbD/TolR family protein [Planctomycetota bacterium]|jgi:biopolymer transport protein ExbD